MRPPESQSIADIILGPARPGSSKGVVWAMLATLSLHGVAGALAWRAWREGPSHAPVAEEPKKPALRVEHVVELPPPAPPMSPSPPPAQVPPPPARVRAARSAPRAQQTPPPAPAQAGAVVAAREAEAPLDFTGFDIASGDAPRYAGGVTASNGTSTTAVESAQAGGEGLGSGPSRARSIQLPARNWACPWPREADALRIDEQTVMLRVVVTPEGRVTSAELVSDPGHGFGQAALACAHGARFEAALDSKGTPYLATSPPIRVRFTRR